MLTVGAILQGRYRVLRTIGGGGMGIVYLAEDTRLANKPLAIKELAPDPRATPAEQAHAQSQFWREATLLAHLDHPNLPHVSDHFTEGGNLFLVMEYVQGETLTARLIRSQNGLSEARVLIWAKQLCNVLSYLHNQSPPVVFRDLKPDNVMVTSDGVIKLIDFGIARLFDRGRQSSDTLKMGTPGYAPPEQYGGRGQTDARSDIYALGATLHHLLTGIDPQLTPFTFEPLRNLNPGISRRTSRAVMKALALKPADRFQTVNEMQDALFKPEPTLTRRYSVVAGVTAGLFSLILIAWQVLHSTPPPVELTLIATAAIASPMAGGSVATDTSASRATRTFTPTFTSLAPIPTTLTPTPTGTPLQPTFKPEPQLVRWGPIDGLEPGICINSCDEFIPWAELEEEMEQKLLPQVSNVPVGSTITLEDLQGKQDWIVQIIAPSGNEIGHIWFGSNVANDWAFDGLVRVGTPSAPAVIWGTFQRYSDGSYRKQ
jgi:serine/threonine protein kinase